LKKRAALLVIVFYILSSCSTPPESQTPERNDLADSSQDSSPFFEANNVDNEDFDPQVNPPNLSEQTTLTNQVQALNLDPNQVRVVSTSQIEWSDSCLGVDQPGVECFPQITQGYWVVMEANGLQFEYHSDLTGSNIQPATPALSWIREGGEQGYCDRLIIYLPDTAYACWCQSGEMKAATVNLLDTLSVEEYDQLIDLLREFNENTVNQSSSGGSDSAMVSLTFYGQGEEFPNSGQQQSFLAIAQEIFSRITP
jgi:hypothetical protein